MFWLVDRSPPTPPNVRSRKAMRSPLAGLWGVIECSWGVLAGRPLWGPSKGSGGLPILLESGLEGQGCRRRGVHREPGDVYIYMYMQIPIHIYIYIIHVISALPKRRPPPSTALKGDPAPTGGVLELGAAKLRHHRAHGARLWPPRGAPMECPCVSEPEVTWVL